jgi:hypothetical protein
MVAVRRQITIQDWRSFFAISAHGALGFGFADEDVENAKSLGEWRRRPTLSDH